MVARRREPDEALPIAPLGEPVEAHELHEEATPTGTQPRHRPTATAAGMGVRVAVTRTVRGRDRQSVFGQRVQAAEGAHLTVQRRSTAAHPSISTQVRDFVRRHLSADLPYLRAQQDQRPGQLQVGPEEKRCEE